jgi:hypothetical protein
MTDPNTPASAPDDVAELRADVVVTRDGVLTISLDDGKTLEVALTPQGALMLAKMLVDFACPGDALRAAVVTGRA